MIINLYKSVLIRINLYSYDFYRLLQIITDLYGLLNSQRLIINPYKSLIWFKKNQYIRNNPY